jgi:hypothetical protein
MSDTQLQVDGVTRALQAIVVGSGILVAATLSGLPSSPCYALQTAYILGGLGMGVTFTEAALAILVFLPRHEQPKSRPRSTQVPAHAERLRSRPRHIRAMVATGVIFMTFLMVVFAGNFNVWWALEQCHAVPKTATNDSPLAEREKHLHTGVYLFVLPAWWVRPSPEGYTHRNEFWRPSD